MQGPRLADAPGGRAYLTQDTTLRRGQIVFAENCAKCHSSKQPPAGTATTQQQYLEWMRSEVQKPDFLDNNFLSTEERIPIDVVQTNAARALATNATQGYVWDNFSSETYKTLPSAGEIDVQNPFNLSTQKFQASNGGPGYYRVPSLIGIWATAPFLHNNALGNYTGDPSVAGRMKAFDDAAEKLLWPDKRLGLASIPRTTTESYIQIPASYLPAELQTLTDGGFLNIGPIPAGTPIDLIANADLDLSDKSKAVDRVKLIAKAQADLIQIKLKKPGFRRDASGAGESHPGPAEDQQVSGLCRRPRSLLWDTASRRRQTSAHRIHEDVLTVPHPYSFSTASATQSHNARRVVIKAEKWPAGSQRRVLPGQCRCKRSVSLRKT